MILDECVTVIISKKLGTKNLKVYKLQVKNVKMLDRLKY